MKFKYQDIEIGIDLEPEPGLADSGDLEYDLQSLLQTVGMAARQAQTAVVLFIDELQYIKELAALIMALHQSARRSLPIILMGAGLPQLRGRMGNAKSYSERLFDFPNVGPLSDEDAALAVLKPAEELNVHINADALDRIVEVTRGYPYFLQEWGKHVWDVTDASPVTLKDVDNAGPEVIAALDESFFLVRFDRLTPLEKRYLRGMAELGPGSHRSGDIAGQLKRPVVSISPTRARLINKGMIWSPNHGDTEFTVPLFDEFLKRIMPGDAWKS